MGLLALRGRRRSRERAVRTDKPKVPGTPASLDVPDSGAEHPKAGLESPKSGPENPKPGPENPKTGPESPKRSPENPKSGPENPKRSPENPKPSPENPKPGSAADLRARSDRLAPGHPSSPVEADGTRKPAAPRLQDIALPEPLTDAEHAEHVKEVRDRLDKAREHGLRTDQQHTIDRAQRSGQRSAMHSTTPSLKICIRRRQTFLVSVGRSSPVASAVRASRQSWTSMPRSTGRST